MINLISFYFFLIFFLFPVLSQNIGPVIQEEKKPTSKDPSYKPSMYPFFLRKQTELSPVQKFLLQPDLSIDQFLLNQTKSKEINPEINLSEENLMLNHKEYYIQKYFLPQLGNNSFYNESLFFIEPPLHQESRWERRGTIFMLSLPATVSISYGILRSYKHSKGLPPTLNQNESIGLFLFSAFFSLYIVYYDENYHKGIENYAKELYRKNKILDDKKLNKD